MTMAQIAAQPDPEWSRPAAAPAREQARRDAEQAYRGLSPAALNAERHLVHHQLPKTWLCPVSPLSALDVDQRIAVLDDAALDVEIELAYLACAISDVAVQPGGAHALTMLFAPVADLLDDLPFPTDLAAMMLAWTAETDAARVEAEQLSTWDHRPVTAHVGYELPDADVALDELPGWVQDNLRRSPGVFRAAIHRHAGGEHLTSIQLGVAVDRLTGEPVHLCHHCDNAPGLRTSHACWVSDSTVTVLTVAAAVAA
jgi:hypothetical protein